MALPPEGATSSDPGQECRGPPSEANTDGGQTMVGLMGVDEHVLPLTAGFYLVLVMLIEGSWFVEGLNNQTCSWCTRSSLVAHLVSCIFALFTFYCNGCCMLGCGFCCCLVVGCVLMEVRRSIHLVE